jgi:hypothetical protein
VTNWAAFPAALFLSRKAFFHHCAVNVARILGDLRRPAYDDQAISDG